MSYRSDHQRKRSAQNGSMDQAADAQVDVS
jgi:hypothetical protein